MKTQAFAAAAALVAGATLIAGAVAPVHASDMKKKADVRAEVSMDKRFCVVSARTGSRIRHTECKTRRQWIEENQTDPVDYLK